MYCHNIAALINHLVTSAKYRRAVFDDKIEKELKHVRKEIEKSMK